MTGEESSQVKLQLPLLCRLTGPGHPQRAGGKDLCAVPLHAATPANLAEQAQREAEALAEKLSVDHLPSPEQQVPSWEC